MVQSAPLLDQRSFCLLLSFFVWCCRVGKCSIMNMIQVALCLTRILSSGMECLCLVLVCWNVHRVHAQTRGLVADVHVCMMCNQSATDSFVIKAVATSRHNLWHNLWHVLVNSPSCGAGASGCCMSICYTCYFRSRV